MKQAMLSNGPDLETTFYGLLSCVFPVRSENGNVMLGDIEIVATGAHRFFPWRSGLEVGCLEPKHIAPPLATVRSGSDDISTPAGVSPANLDASLAVSL